MLLAPALAGCGGAHASDSTTQAGTGVSAAATRPIVLRLHLDTGRYAITGAKTTLRGTATRGASVAVNRQLVQLHDGRWQRTLSPHLGANRIVVEATMSGHAPVVRSITVTRHRTAAEVEASAIAAQEAETRAAERKAAESRAAEPPPASKTEAPTACTNGTYVNSAGNTVCKPEESPTVPAGATARCEDGTYSFSESRSGTCSHHGGVAEWLSG